MYEINTNIKLMESTNAKINRLEQTIRELKQINKIQLNNINELGKALVTKAEVETSLRDEILELKTELNNNLKAKEI